MERTTHFGVRYIIITNAMRLRAKIRWFKSSKALEKFITKGLESGSIHSVEAYCTEERY